MRSYILYSGFFIIFLVSKSISAQRLHELTPYSFYQKWGLNSEESQDNLIVYRSKQNVNPVDVNHTFSFLKFNRQNHDLYYLNPSTPEKRKPVSWSNVPNKGPKYRPRCGNEFIGSENKSKKKGVKFEWKKGIWNVYVKDETKFLVLDHMALEKGKAYKLERKEEFQIVSLEEDKMVLRKVNAHVKDF